MKGVHTHRHTTTRSDLDSVEVRSLRLHLIPGYKIIFEPTDIESMEATPSRSSTAVTGSEVTRYKLVPSHCRVDLRNIFITQRAIKP